MKTAISGALSLFLIGLLGVVGSGCSNAVEPTDQNPLSTIIGSWNRYQSPSIFIPNGFREEVNFKSDGSYLFITTGLNEVDGQWRSAGNEHIVISDTVCRAEGTFAVAFNEGRVYLEGVDSFDDECGRATTIAGEWYRSVD